MFLTSNLFSFILACVFNPSTFSVEGWAASHAFEASLGYTGRLYHKAEQTLMVSKLKHSAQLSPWKSKVQLFPGLFVKRLIET